MSGDKKLSTFDHYCQVSSCMGVLEWYSAKHIFGKVFWASILIVCISLTAWQTWGTVMEFVDEKPYQTTISKGMKHDGMKYPNITVCNFNRIKQSLIESDGVDPRVFTYIFQLFPVTYDLPAWYHKEDSFEYEEAFLNYSKSSGLTPLQVLSKYGHSAEDTFFKISVNNGMKMIHPNELEEVFTAYGRCWTIIPDFKQIFPGPNGGLRMLLNPLLSEYMEEGTLNNYLQEGLVIFFGFVQEQMTLQPIYLAPGSAASISLKLFENTITVPKAPLRAPLCNQNPTLKFVNASYSPSNCIFDCFMEALYEKCGCVYVGNTLQLYPLCNRTTVENCVLNNMEGYLVSWNVHILAFMTDCKRKCLNPCKPIFTVEPTVTVADFPNSRVRKSLRKILVERNKVKIDQIDEILNSVISVNVYYPHPEVSISDTSESTPIFTFIGNLGGQLGLWTGISMLTIVQLGYYIIIGCLKIPWRRKKNEYDFKSSRVHNICCHEVSKY